MHAFDRSRRAAADGDGDAGNAFASMRAAGLDDAEILDLILSTALFGWANRLMHTLGDPVAKEGEG